MVRFASEDIGNADPNALVITMQAAEAYRMLGSPEGDLALAQAAVYLATAPKSASIYKAFGEAVNDAKSKGSLPVPLHIRNAPTSLMKSIGYGDNYKYAHNYEEGYVSQEYFPEELKETVYYKPVPRGFEREIIKRLEYWKKLKLQLNDNNKSK